MKFILLLAMTVMANQRYEGNRLMSEIWGDTDSTLVSTKVFYYGKKTDTSFCRYYFDPSDYWKANSVIDESMFGFNNLNVMAQKEYMENLHVLKDMECYSTRKELELHKRNKSNTLNPGETK